MLYQRTICCQRRKQRPEQRIKLRSEPFCNNRNQWWTSTVHYRAMQCLPSAAAQLVNWSPLLACKPSLRLFFSMYLKGITTSLTMIHPTATVKASTSFPVLFTEQSNCQCGLKVIHTLRMIPLRAAAHFLHCTQPSPFLSACSTIKGASPCCPHRGHDPSQRSSSAI